jgi:hypothetical protein
MDSDGTQESRCCKPWCTPLWGTISAIIGVALIIAAIIVPPAIRSLVDTKLCDQLCIPEAKDVSDPDYWQYSNWLTNDNSTVNPPEYYKYYFFNMTNVAAVVAGAKPVLQVVGPYVFQVRKFKSVTSCRTHNSHSTNNFN